VLAVSINCLSVKLNVAGNEKLWPTDNGPVGKDEFSAVKTVFVDERPKTLVIGMFAVQFMSNVSVEPIVTLPKSIGAVQVSGWATGLPRHIMCPSTVDRYSLPSPNAGRWYLLMDGVDGISIFIIVPSG
jgi:hypothetical protein